MFGMTNPFNWGSGEEDQTSSRSDAFGRIPDKTETNPTDPPLRKAWQNNDPLPLVNETTKGLTGDVGRQSPNDREDVSKVESLLGVTGNMDLKKTEGPTGYFGETTDQALKSFQKEKNLKVDGLVTPDGPTINTLLKDWGSQMQAKAKEQTKTQQPRRPAQTITTPNGHSADVQNPPKDTGQLGKDIDKFWPKSSIPKQAVEAVQGAGNYASDKAINAFNLLMEKINYDYRVERSTENKGHYAGGIR